MIHKKLLLFIIVNVLVSITKIIPAAGREHTSHDCKNFKDFVRLLEVDHEEYSTHAAMVMRHRPGTIRDQRQQCYLPWIYKKQEHFSLARSLLKNNTVSIDEIYSSKTALKSALMTDNKSLAKLLLQHGASVPQPLEKWISKHHAWCLPAIKEEKLYRDHLRQLFTKQLVHILNKTSLNQHHTGPLLIIQQYAMPTSDQELIALTRRLVQHSPSQLPHTT